MANGETGFADIEYDLVLLQYQSLKDYGQYVRDAKNAGRQDVASFFEQVKSQEFERAKRCHELLATVHTSL